MPDATNTVRGLRDRLLRRSGAADLVRKRDELELARDQLMEHLARLEADKAVIKDRRLALQEALGARAGKQLQSRDKFEKTAGLPSLLASHSAWDRIWRQTVELQSGRDEARDVFADRAATEAYLTSYGVPLAPEGASTDVTVAVFQDRVGVVEIGHDLHLVVEADGTTSLVGDGDQAAAARRPGGSAAVDVVAGSGRLGSGIPRPYVRIGWSLAGDRPAVTHVDVDPATIPFVDHDHDRVLGDLHELALIKIQQRMIGRGALDIRVPDGRFVPRTRR